MPYLLHKDRDGSVIQFWNLHDGPLTIGRGKEANAEIKDDELSRTHFVVSQRDAGFYLKDLESKNGTLINGQRVTEQQLKQNDKIQAGHCEFQCMDGLTTIAGQIKQDEDNLARF